MCIARIIQIGVVCLVACIQVMRRAEEIQFASDTHAVY